MPHNDNLDEQNRAAARETLRLTAQEIRRKLLDDYPELMLDQAVNYAVLFAAIDTLPKELQEVVMLLHFQGMTQAEVAGLFGVHEDTVKRWWASARRQLADTLSAFNPNAAD